jgi:predicted nucleic acid-binding protein
MKLYIETSVPNMLLHDDAPDLKRMTQEFFDWARVCSDEFYTSALTEAEIARAPARVREDLLAALRSLHPELLDITAESRGLAQLYLSEGILPARFSDDALHVAVAVCHRMDAIVTWNMKHLANMRRVELINRLNLRQSMPAIRIHTPAEVIES